MDDRGRGFVADRLDVAVGQVVAREMESREIAQMLERATVGPAGLVITGEAGIGKTTLWLGAIEHATELGYRVLSSRAAPTEVRFALSAVADLLSGLGAGSTSGLSELQRAALDRVLLRGNAGPDSDEHLVAAALLAVIEGWARDMPVLMAIDDAQWVDGSSRAVLGFALRRLRGRVGVLATVRAGEREGGVVPSWITLPRPEQVARIALCPLSLSGVHALIAQRLDRTLPRPALVRIAEVSGGNPFYALELARSWPDGSMTATVLPPTLAEVVRARIEHLPGRSRDVLLAAACVSAPTTELLAAAMHLSMAEIVEVLDSAQTEGLVLVEGNRVRFMHPLLSHGVYGVAGRAQQRRMHQRLAGLVTEPELQARHLALAAAHADPDTLAALDRGVEAAIARGAPTAAAELLDLAVGLGGDTLVRKLRAAELLFRAGAVEQARSRVESLLPTLRPGTTRAAALTLLGAVFTYAQSFDQAVRVLTQAVEEAGDAAAVRLYALLLLTPVTGMHGYMKEATDHARAAVVGAEELGIDALLSEALAIWVTVGFLYGLGADMAALQRALDLETQPSHAHVCYQASAVAGMIAGWTGQLEDARTRMAQVKQRCEERGAEVELMWVAEQGAMIDIWSGRYHDAAEKAREVVARADQIGGPHVRILAETLQTAVAAYVGGEDDARRHADAAITAAEGMGASFLAAGSMRSLAFLEVSLGNYSAALTVLDPLLAAFDPRHDTEIAMGGHLPDAVEALCAVGQLDSAERLITAMEQNGARLDRTWMLAVGARTRSLWWAAQGELGRADAAARAALVYHEDLAMPFERARTLLVLGQLQRRRRQQRAAAETLGEAAATFAKLGTYRWHLRARDELSHLGGRRRSTSANGLTPTEQRVAEHAAMGMSNRQIAAAMFLAEKTVEMNLSRVYRKLGIRSRAQLFASLNPDGEPPPGAARGGK